MTSLLNTLDECRLYKRELGMGVFNILAGMYGTFITHNLEYSIFLFFQGDCLPATWDFNHLV